MKKWLRGMLLKLADGVPAKGMQLQIELDRLRDMPTADDGGWISVEDDMPPVGEYVQTRNPYGRGDRYGIGYSYDSGCWNSWGGWTMNNSYSLKPKSHWRPIPASERQGD